MFPNKGLFRDTPPINQPFGTWNNARNILMTKVKNAFVNEDGTKVFSNSYPNTIAEPIGATVFPDESVVIYSDGKNGGQDRLGILDASGNYIDIIVDNILGFDKNYPVRSSEYEYNFLGQRIIAWTDKNKTPKILNIDSLPFPLDGAKALINDADFNDAEAFPRFKAPIISYNVLDNGGSVLAGNYSICIAYKNNDGTRTPNSPPIKNINIVDDTSSSSIDKYDGVTPGSLTGKAINVTITNVDTRYDKIVLIIVARIKNQITAFEVKEQAINSSSLTMTYIGTEQTTTLDIQEVLTTRPIYTKVGAMAQYNSTLYHANLESEPDIDYQIYANNIRIFYNTKLVSINDINNSHKNNLGGGFAHGGVYAFYIALLLKNGSWSKAFHIPGRPIYLVDVTAPSTIASAQGLTGKIYQVEDTTNQAGHSYTLDGDTTRVTNMSVDSNMGYWSNENETYPVGFPALAGGLVRHHVFPTIRKCKQLHYSGEAGYGKDKFDVLGIDVVNVQFPAEIQDKIEGWAIFYAKRDYVNSNTFGTDILQFAHKTDNDANLIWSGAGNWNINARQPDGDGASTDWGNDLIMRKDYARGHNFELIKDKPQLSVGNLFIDLELKYSKSNLNGLYKDVGIQGANIAGSGQDEGQNAGGVIDYRDTVNTTISLPVSQTIRRLTEFRYLPNNVIDNNIWTIKNEENIHLGIHNGTSIDVNASPVDLSVNSPSRSAATPFQPGAIEQSYLMTYKQVRTNVYANYDQQILVCTDTVGLPNETSKTKVRGGDTFTSLRSYIASSPRHGGDIGGPDGITIIRAHITESRYNIGLRYEVDGNVNTKYYPKTLPQNFWTNPTDPDENGVEPIFSRNSNINELGYSEDYNAINNLIQLVIYNPSQVTTNRFPNRIIKSGKSGNNSNALNSWKTYLSADIYESNRNRGPIENIATIDDVILIHHYYGLFRTLGTERLSLGATEVYLGQGDILGQQPKEPLSVKNGYLGCQNIYATTSYKGTYSWADQAQGRIFSISRNGVVEISNAGMYNFFRDNLKINNTYPNAPLTGESLLAGYDPKYNRLLFTKKSNTGAFTISYSIDNECWVAEHDYIPDYYYNTSRNIFGFKSGNIHQFNDEASKGKYFGVVYPSYIDLTFLTRRQDNRPEKIQVFNVNWTSEIFNNGILQQDKTLSHLTAWTSYQTMPRTLLIPHSTFGVSANIRRKNSSWDFNNIKTSNIDPFKRRPLVGEYCTIRYEYDNAPNLDSSQNLLYLYDLSCQARKATV